MYFLGKERNHSNQMERAPHSTDSVFFFVVYLSAGTKKASFPIFVLLCVFENHSVRFFLLQYMGKHWVVGIVFAASVIR